MSKATVRKPEWISEIRAIGWDLDGTLFPPGAIPKEEITRRRLEAVVKKNGWRRKEAEDKYRKALARLHSNTKTLTELGVDGVEFFVNLWDLLPLQKYLEKDKELVGLFRSLSRMRNFLLSNSNRLDQIERKLKLVGLDTDNFEFLLSTVDIGEVKPDPKPFLVALERLGLGPEKVLYVGDRVSTDILGARGVGMRTCLVWGESREADVSLPTVYDVVKLFNI